MRRIEQEESEGEVTLKEGQGRGEEEKQDGGANHYASGNPK